MYDISKFGWNDTKYYEVFNRVHKWPDATVWYDIDPHLTGEMRDAVYSAVEYINSLEEICVRWKQRPPYSSGWVSSAYVSFVLYRDTPKESKCFANLGWKKGGRTYINLGIHCARKRATRNNLLLRFVVLHEMMHIMGLHHEHQRPDRDCYVLVHSTVPGSSVSRQLGKLPGEEFPSGFPYDLSSIMQYPRHPNGFVRAHYDELFDIGRTDGKLSPLDIHKLDHLYCGAPKWCERFSSCEHMYDFAKSDPTCWMEGDEYSPKPKVTNFRLWEESSLPDI